MSLSDVKTRRNPRTPNAKKKGIFVRSKELLTRNHSSLRSARRSVGYDRDIRSHARAVNFARTFDRYVVKIEVVSRVRVSPHVTPRRENVLTERVKRDIHFDSASLFRQELLDGEGLAL